MDLLPNTPGDFRRREYWDAVFGSKSSDLLEWYGNYEDFADIFEDCLRRGSLATTGSCNSKGHAPDKFSPFEKSDSGKEALAVALGGGEPDKTRAQGPQEQTETGTREPCDKANLATSLVGGSESQSESRILHVGCGNSELPERLTQQGYGRVVNVDFSSVVIERMKRRYRHVPSLSWECFDIRGGALERRFGEEAFDAVLDKGFFDALASRDTIKDPAGANEEEQRCSAEGATKSILTQLDSNAGVSDVLTLGGGTGYAREEVTDEQRGTCKGQKESKERPETAYRDEAQEYLVSALKVLKTGGVFIIITLAQDYVVKELVRGLYAANVDIKIHPLPLATSRRMAAKAGVKRTRLLPFVFSIEKKHGTLSIGDIRSLGAQRKRVAQEEEKAVRPSATRCVMKAELGRAACEDVFVIWDLPKKIRAVVKWRLLQLALRVRDPGSRSVVSIHNCGIQSVDTRAHEFPRYVVTIYDVVEPRAQKKERTYTRPTAAILAAPGEERCWLFATAEGNEELAKQAGAKRILIVTPGAGPPNDGLPVEGILRPDVVPDTDVQRVSEELGPYLADLALPDSGDIPIMMIGSTTTRVVAERAREHSEFAGWITVRDVEVSDDEEAVETPVARNPPKRKQNTGAKSKQWSHQAKASRKKERQKVLLRQLLFYCNPHTVQSEVKLARSAPRPGRGEVNESTAFAFLQPVCGYHIPTAAAFALLKEARGERSAGAGALEAGRPPRISAVVLGLGGGVLSMFLHTLLGEALSMELACVDIDPVVVDLARKHFGFREFPGRLRCVVDDATAYVKRLPSRGVHAIIVDINSGSPASAMRCPAEEFVREAMLVNMKEALAPGGVLVFNLLCRCLRTKNEVIERLSGIFPSISSIPISEDANEVVICQVDGPHVELPARRGVIDRHLRELVYVLEEYASTRERDKEDIMKCAAQLLNCAREWRVQACRNASRLSTG